MTPKAYADVPITIALEGGDKRKGLGRLLWPNNGRIKWGRRTYEIHMVPTHKTDDINGTAVLDPGFKIPTKYCP